MHRNGSLANSWYLPMFCLVHLVEIFPCPYFSAFQICVKYIIAIAFYYETCLPTPQQTLPYPDVGAAVGDGQGHLAPLAAATALVHVQVIADGIYIIEGGEDIAGEYYRP